MDETKTETANEQFSASNCSAPTDTQRLEWLADHEAMITRGKRAKTRRGGIVAANLEDIWQIEWEGKDGSLIMQGADGGHPNFRDAIDAAMKAQNVGSEALESARKPSNEGA